ncbi:MAG: hypothetical protein IJ904_00515, partial [Candidatus Methanomethylophilaceae archaeon]|nr:hypothetical protein [Candidatus Methanomethylophilaceae archaeon]
MKMLLVAAEVVDVFESLSLKFIELVKEFGRLDDELIVGRVHDACIRAEAAAPEITVVVKDEMLPAGPAAHLADTE